MPSPFPGMDPWLENPDLFPDFHNRLIIVLSEALNAALPPGYVATSANRVWVSDDHMREPDVSLLGNGPRREGQVGLLARPGVIQLSRPAAREPSTETYLEIRTSRGRKLITAIEVLSLSNKQPGNSRKAYLQKQDELILASVSLVEVDLLRGGLHTSIALPRELREEAGSPDYHVSIMRPWADDGHGDVGVVPVRMRGPLPSVPVPLEAGMPSVVVELQPLLDRCYDSGRSGELTDYHTDPEPALSPENQAWAEALLRQKGLRN